jgi:hypothetical protein
LVERGGDQEVERAAGTDGFCLHAHPGSLDRDALRDLAVRFDRHLQTLPEWRGRGMEELSFMRDVETRSTLQSELLGMLDDFFSTTLPAFRPVLPNLLVKRANSPGGMIVPHRDMAIVDETKGEASLQVWIPLIDVDRSNGALRVMPRSHRLRDPIRALGDSLAVDATTSELEERMTSVSMRAGDVLVFHGRTIHSSPPNTTSMDRPAIGCMLARRDAPLVLYSRVAETRVRRFCPTDEQLRLLRFDLPTPALAGGEILEEPRPRRTLHELDEAMSG